MFNCTHHPTTLAIQANIARSGRSPPSFSITNADDRSHGLFIDEDRSDVTTCYENYVANSHFRSWLDLILRMSS